MKLVFSVLCSLAIPLVVVNCTGSLEMVQPDGKFSYVNGGNDLSSHQEKFVTLHDAAKNGQCDVVGQLLDNGVNVNAIDSDGRTPMYFAALHGHADIIKILLYADADVHVRDNQELTVIHAAAQSGHDKCLSILVKMGAMVNAEDKNRMTPIHYAALNGHYKTIAALLAFDADVSPRDNLLKTPLHFASEKGHAKAVFVLLEKGADVKAVDSTQCTPLLRAACNGHARVTQLLIERGADIRALDKCDNTALHLAVEEGHYHTILVLLDYIRIASSANVILMWSPLHLAAYTNRLDVSRKLVDEGVDFNARDMLGSTALHNAAHSGHWSMVQMLISRGAEVNAFNSHGQTPLHLAARRNHAAVTLLLIRHGACVSAVDRSKRTPLHIAARKQNAAVIRVLLSDPQTTAIVTCSTLGWSPVHLAAYMGNLDVLITLPIPVVNSRDANGLTPLHCAALGGRAEAVRLLLERHGSISARDKDKWTSLHCAVLGGCIEAIFALIISRNAHTIDGSTPLHVAAQCGNVSAMSILLQSGADIGALDQHKHTPLHTAALYGHAEMLNVLSQHITMTVIHTAASNGNPEIILNLLEAGFGNHVNDHDRMTPLHHAVANGHAIAAKLLLSQDLSLVHAKDAFDMTPLHYAAQKGHPTCAQLLLTLDADCNAIDSLGRTPLFLAALHGHSDLINMLLTHGAGVEVGSVRLNHDLARKWDPHSATIELLEERVTEATIGSTGLVSLHAAAWGGHCDAASILLRRGVNVNRSDAGGLTPLHFAAYKGHYAMIELLLSNGSNINSTDVCKESPLIFAAGGGGHYEAIKSLLRHSPRVSQDVLFVALLDAAVRGHTSVAHILLQNGAPTDMRSEYSSPLSLAARDGHTEVVKLLLDAGAYTGERWFSTDNPFRLALRNSRHAVTKLLLEHETSTSITGERTLGWLLDVVEKTNDWKLVTMLLNMGFDPDKKVTVKFRNGDISHISLLHFAECCGRSHVVKALIEHGARIEATDERGQTPFFLAVKYGNVQTAKLPREYGANDVANSGNGETPLSITIKYIREIHLDGKSPYRPFEMLLALLENETTINSYAAALSWNPLHRIAYTGSVEAFEIWVEDTLAAQGRNVNPGDQFLSTPLHYAALLNHLDFARRLIINHAEVNAENFIGQTPLYYAALNGHYEMIELLLKNGADSAIAYEANSETTPLHVAARKRHYKAVCMLLRDKSLVPHAKSALNWTPLHMAAYTGDLFALNELLLHQDTLDINARDIFGATALHYAVMTRNNSTAKTLLIEGADLSLKNRDGDTPLHIAAVYKHLDMISLLLNFGASNFYSVNADGNVPFMSALNEGCLDVLTLFILDVLASRKLS